MAKRKILLTTLSTVRNRHSVNYYCWAGEGVNRFCDGIASVEAGTKYFLTYEDIDKIVVIGSGETFDERDDLEECELKSVWKSIDNDSVEHLSAYGFYKYRISRFLDNDRLNEKDLDIQIDPARKKELESIVSDILEGEYKKTKRKQWFSFIAESNEGWNRIISVVRQDIGNSFLTEEDYRKYTQPIMDYPQMTELQQDAKKTQQVIKNMEDKLQAILDDQQAYQTLKEGSAQAIVHALEEMRLEYEIAYKQKQVSSYREIILMLRKAIERLHDELVSLKKHRMENEIAYIKYYIYQCCSQNYKLVISQRRETKICFIPAYQSVMQDSTNRIDIVDNLQEIVTAIRGEDKDDIVLYIDMQGGSRTDGYVRNAALSILNNDSKDSITIKQIIATNFEPHNFTNRIVDETKRYKVTDLVSGMNAFLQYGKADLIERYYQSAGTKDKDIECFIQQMKDIDEAISICNVDGMIRSIENLKKTFKGTKRWQKSSLGNEFFQILYEGIQRDYQPIIESDEKSMVLCIIDWAVSKGFLQQALTIVESKFPQILVRNGLFYYMEEDDKDRSEIVGKFKALKDSKSTKEKYKFKEVDHYFIRFYMLEENIMNIIKSKKKEKKDYSFRVTQMDLLELSSEEGIPARTVVNSDGGKKALQELFESYERICVDRNDLNHAKGTITRKDIENHLKELLKNYSNLKRYVNKVVRTESLFETDLK